MERIRHHYRVDGLTIDDIDGLSKDYFEDLARNRCSLKELSEIFPAARRKCKYFPLIPELLEFLAEIRTHREISRVSLPEPNRTEEEIKKGKEGVSVINQILRGEITEEEGQKKIKELGLIEGTNKPF